MALPQQDLTTKNLFRTVKEDLGKNPTNVTVKNPSAILDNITTLINKLGEEETPQGMCPRKCSFL